MHIRTAVIAVAGYGTRFLPATKSVAKELLPIVDKPIVQYLVEEAASSGIEDIILVIRSGTHGIADHFDSSRELEVHLQEQGKHDYLEIVRSIPRLANFAFVRQGRHLPYGNGSPILAAKSFLSRDEPFVYMFGDDLVLSETPCVKQLVDVYARHNPQAVIAFQEIPPSEAYRYGIAKLKPGTDPVEMESIVEKPSPGSAPSRLAQIGRFVLSPEVIEILERIEVPPGGELYLTEAIDVLCRRGRVLVHKIEGAWHTTGDPLRYLISNVEYALRHPEIAKDFAAYLRGLKTDHLVRTP
jgi:UTP--glucose-1-phosphate uridylyltransferase